MCRYKRQEEHPGMLISSRPQDPSLTLAKALRGKEQHRNGRDGGEGIEGPLDLMAWRKQKQRNWRGVGAPCGPPGLCKEEHLRGGQSHACVAITYHTSLTLLRRRKKNGL